MKTSLRTKTGQKTLEDESKQDPNAKERLEFKGQFSTFGVPNATLKVPNFHDLGFGLMGYG